MCNDCLQHIISAVLAITGGLLYVLLVAPHLNRWVELFIDIPVMIAMIVVTLRCCKHLLDANPDAHISHI
ncbi:MAG: hypothetical protein JWN38_907 [Candidatus Saccharibacteria bacterium]|nr:hypothetical protein [Candidatus Saccharibacteria bacterium]